MSIKIQKVKTFVKNNRLLMVILFLALVLRLAYFLIINPPLTWSDASVYDTLGWNLIQGNDYSLDGTTPTAYVEPGYPLFFIAPFYFIFGHNIIPIQIFQTILSIASIFIIYLIGNKFFDKKIGLTSAFLWALWPAEIVFNQELLTEIPFTFLLLLSIFFLLNALKNNHANKMLIAAGCLLGMATITRFVSFFLPFFFLPAFYIIFKSHQEKFLRKSLKYFLALFIGIAIFFTPWAIRNYVNFNTFYLGRPGIGVGIWKGSYVPWQGEWKSEVPLALDKIINVTDDKNYLKHDLRYLKENFSSIVKIWSKKPYKIFLKSAVYGQITHNQDLVKFLSVNPIIDTLARRGLQFTHLTIMLFGPIGLLYLFWKKEIFVSLIFATLIIYFIAIYLPFSPDARYQVPLMPYIIILASVGFWNLFNKIRGKNNSYYSRI